MAYRVAVVGATGNVGREMLKTLYDRAFPVSDVIALASDQSEGREVSFGDTDILKVQTLASFDFKGTDIVLSSAGGRISSEFAPRAAKSGSIIIDNTSFFRMDPDVPLVVPEVNPDALKDFYKKNIIANPNCSTIHRVVALKPLHDLATIKRATVATYQSVSGAGKKAMDSLFNQTKSYYVGSPVNLDVFPKQIAFNCIPMIDVEREDGFTAEEYKQAAETQKILDPHIKLVATCVRVPVFIGHGEVITVEFEKQITVEQAKNALKSAPGVTLVDNPKADHFVTQIEAVGEDTVYVSRLRKDPTVQNGLTFWIVSDNLRKGAALNAVQIAEKMIADYM